MKTGAIIDSTQKYRYSLWREWDIKAPRVAFIMLNPSTANEKDDDPTIKKCIGFAKLWGYGALEVVNLFAYRATNSGELCTVADPVGDQNDNYLIDAMHRCELIVVAWGEKGALQKRNEVVCKALTSIGEIYCLGTGKKGHPRHPLFLRYDTDLVKYS